MTFRGLCTVAVLALALAPSASARARGAGAPARGEPAKASTTAPQDPPPPALPNPNDPLERLWGRKQLTFAQGSPTVTVALMEGQASVRFVPRGRMRLKTRGKVEKVLEAPANSEWTIRVRDYRPGRILWSVLVAEFPFAEREQLAEAETVWKERGREVHAATIGSLYGIAGRVLDNRRQQLLLGDARPETEAREVLKSLRQQYGVQATLQPNLVERPHGRLEVVDASGAVLAAGDDLVMATSPDRAAFAVKQVEHGKGYSWHGRQDRTYRGELAFAVDNHGGIAVVNELPLEEYLRGIVPSEIFARAHVEALKAQAVTARGEVLAKLGTRHLTDPYLLCAEQHCQVYSGMSGEAASTDAAIAATAGQLLFAADGGPLVNSVYSATCGGHTENNEIVWGGHPDPALRGRPDVVTESASLASGLSGEKLSAFLARPPKSWCSVSSFAKPQKFRWERRFKQEELDEIARPYGIGPVRVIAVAHRGVSGRGNVLTLAGEQGATQIRGELAIRQLLKNLNSAMFEVEAPGPGHPGEWVFRGGGWGHGVGMCQVGAIGRAEAGQSYREILRHYYNGAEILRIY